VDKSTTQSINRPIGHIAGIYGPVVDIVCEALPPLHRALSAATDHLRYVFEVHQHLDNGVVRAITLQRTGGLRRGMPVFDSGNVLSVPVDPNCLGRLLNIFGQPLDGKPPLPKQELRAVLARPAVLHEAVPASGILETGIKVIDLLCPFVRGGKTGLFGGAGEYRDALMQGRYCMHAFHDQHGLAHAGAAE